MTASLILAQHGAASRRNPLGLYEPLSLSIHSWRRFRRLRRVHYLSQLDGRRPTPEEADIIDQLCRVGWDERVIRAEVEATTDQRLRTDLRGKVAELGRQQILLRRDLDRAAPPPAAAEKPRADGEDTARRALNDLLKAQREVEAP
jgi:hypothetical protein